MKIIIYPVFFTFIIFQFYSCNQFSSASKNSNNRDSNTTYYEIKGNILGKENTVILLSDSTGDILQKTTIKDNRFVLLGTPENKIVFLHFEDQEKTPIFLDTLVYNVRTWDNNPERLWVTAPQPQQQAYNAYQKELANIDRQLLPVCPSLHDTDEFKKKEFLDQFLALKEKRNELTENFISTNKHSFVGLLELKRNLPFLGTQRCQLLFDSLDSLLQVHRLGQELVENLTPAPIATTIPAKSHTPPHPKQEVTARTKKPATIPQPKKPERFPAPTFNGLSPEGYLVDLQSVIAQNKIIMLDFWGTWCQPCRMQNPYWERLYRKYHAQGFEIISIAEETSETRPNLETVISEEGMNWLHIVDLNNEIAELYRAYSLPHAVLIDNEGKLIYHKATARDIQEYLQEYFK